MPPVTIAIDALGGDRAPEEIVAGARLAALEEGLSILLVGARDRLSACLDPADRDRLPIVDAPDVVGMGESPLAALRRKPHTSIKVACELLRDGRAHAVLSAGHTGATLLAARTTLDVLPGVDRPALAVLLPTRTGSTVLVDAGANIDCRAEHLVQFGVMGSAYARVALGRDRPSVGLLSIGEEPGKGTDLIRAAHEGLSRAPIHFVGNVEPREVFAGKVDVVVCDGFVGNVVLKTGEGVAALVEGTLREELNANAAGRLGGWLAGSAFRRLKRRLDDAERGAAPLIGVAGIVVVAHGRSSARAIHQGIVNAARLAAGHFVERTRAALEETMRSSGSGQSERDV